MGTFGVHAFGIQPLICKWFALSRNVSIIRHFRSQHVACWLVMGCCRQALSTHRLFSACSFDNTKTFVKSMNVRRIVKCALPAVGLAIEHAWSVFARRAL